MSTEWFHANGLLFVLLHMQCGHTFVRSFFTCIILILDSLEYTSISELICLGIIIIELLIDWFTISV